MYAYCVEMKGYTYLEGLLAIFRMDIWTLFLLSADENGGKEERRIGVLFSWYSLLHRNTGSPPLRRFSGLEKFMLKKMR